MDPHHEDEDGEFMDTLNVGQSILLEVWDSDSAFSGGSKDFLGECWLPPLSTFLSGRPKNLVLPLKPADMSEGAENGASREDSSKITTEMAKTTTEAHKKISGDLYVQVTWVSPGYEPDSLGLPGDDEPTEKIVEFKKKGLPFAKEQTSNGITVKDVTKGSEADLAGVKKGWRVLKVDGEGSDGFVYDLDKTAKSGKPYSITFERVEAEQTLEERAKVQRLLHTGKLTIVIQKAKSLRKADWFRGRECDAFTQIWRRNDVMDDGKGLWHGRPIGHTKVDSKNGKNPVWNHTFNLEIMTGEFESKLPKEELGLFANFKNEMIDKFGIFSKIKQKKQMSRDLSSVRRFTDDGTQVYFRGENLTSDGPQMVTTPRTQRVYPQLEGGNHKTVIYLNDTIFSFKRKLEKACVAESQYWSNRSDNERANAYQDIKLTSKALVMVFVPNNKVHNLHQQGLDNTEQYRQAYNQALLDPSSWQPLDNTRKFREYAQYGFAANAQYPQKIRVVEATEGYKTRNSRYREFARNQSTTVYEDKDTEREAFGWAKYIHKDDKADTQKEDKGSRGTSTEKIESTTEWRPCIASKPVNPDGKPGNSRMEGPGGVYAVQWLYPGSQTQVNATGKDECRKQEVLLKPRYAKFDDIVDHRQMPTLEQAPRWRQTGKGDHEIAQILQRQLQDDPQYKDADPNDKIPDITVDVVKAYLLRIEREKATGKP
jgi:hypothetical protein